MGDLRVRELDDAIILELRDRAKREGLTVPGLVRQILLNDKMRRRQETLRELDELREAIRAEVGILPDSTPGIRAARDGLE